MNIRQDYVYFPAGDDIVAHEFHRRAMIRAEWDTTGRSELQIKRPIR